MNTSELKRFAQGARIKLLEQVASKLSFVLTTDSPELREKIQQIKQLREELNKTTKEQLVEKVAYTWFNRFMALRFMDANDYQPLGIRIITPKEGYTSPELLDEAKRGNIPEELPVQKQRVYDLLDGKIPSINAQNEAFKELLIAACNYLNAIFPFLFEKINDYTELLLPDDLTSDFSIVNDVRNGMVNDDCRNVEIIGWLYQFYISEKKDEVFASKSKVPKENIPAITQLFTPRWIVEYMVQNTLGKLWLQNRPKSRLREHMPYFIESASLISEDYLKIQSPEEIKFLDPASGSGHILVYAFDLFTKIYEEEGYNTNEIPKLIIEYNLFGFEIDERAAQLSALALMMKAREYQRRVFNTEIISNILCYNDLQVSLEDIKDVFQSQGIKISDNLKHDLVLLQQATNVGSLIIPLTDIAELNIISVQLHEFLLITDIFKKKTVEAILDSMKQLKMLSLKYNCVVANPPYMGSANMNLFLSEFVKKEFPTTKSDLMACFMERGLQFLMEKGFLGMINQQAWMFISTYKNLRKFIIDNYSIDTLVQIGFNTFPELNSKLALGVMFTFCNRNDIEDGIYFNLNDSSKSADKRLVFKNKIEEHEYFQRNQKVFIGIPDYIFGYWLSDKLISLFKNKSIGEVADVKVGMHTGSNEIFIRFWYEVSQSKINFSGQPKISNKGKWFPYNKGGEYRKWYGNHYYIVNWENDGRDIHSFHNIPLTHNGAPVRAKGSQFKNMVSWSFIGYNFGVRFYPQGFMFDVSGSSILSEDEIVLKFLSGLLNSKVAKRNIKCAKSDT